MEPGVIAAVALGLAVLEVRGREVPAQGGVKSVAVPRVLGVTGPVKVEAWEHVVGSVLEHGVRGGEGPQGAAELRLDWMAGVVHSLTEG